MVHYICNVVATDLLLKTKIAIFNSVQEHTESCFASLYGRDLSSQWRTRMWQCLEWRSWEYWQTLLQQSQWREDSLQCRVKSFLCHVFSWQSGLFFFGMKNKPKQWKQHRVRQTPHIGGGQGANSRRKFPGLVSRMMKMMMTLQYWTRTRLP